MAAITIDGPTGCLVIDGQKVFPLGLSDAPPVDAATPEGHGAWSEIAAAGANFIRSGRPDWRIRTGRARFPPPGSCGRTTA
jgi:hypothetical protein